MESIKGLFRSADWKSEKHVPAIECAPVSGDANAFEVSVSVGREIPHPNTTAHHIKWVDLYFLPEGEKTPYSIGRSDFSAHGASVNGPDTSGVYTRPLATFVFQAEKPGTLLACSYCNIHGLWESSLALCP